MKNTKTKTRIQSILSSGVTVEGKLPIGSFVETKNGKREVVQHVTKRYKVVDFGSYERSKAGVWTWKTEKVGYWSKY